MKLHTRIQSKGVQNNKVFQILGIIIFLFFSGNKLSAQFTGNNLNPFCSSFEVNCIADFASLPPVILDSFSLCTPLVYSMDTPVFNAFLSGGSTEGCAGSVYTVLWGVEQDCGGSPVNGNCTQNYKLIGNIPFDVVCPVNTQIAACVAQADLDIAFDNWLASVTPVGGCSPTLVNDWDGVYIQSCTGGAVTVTFTLTDGDCSDLAPVICSSTFEVASPTPLSIACPADLVVSCMAEVVPDIAAATPSGGCGPYVVTVGAEVAGAANSPCGQTDGDIYTITYSATDACGTIIDCIQTFTINSAEPLINCPALSVVTCEADVVAGTATPILSCGLTGAVTIAGPVLTGLPDCDGTIYTYTHTVTDGCDRTASCEQTITLSNLAPTIDCSALITTVTCAADVAPGVPTYVTSCALVGGLVVSGVTISGTPDCDGTTYTYVHTVSDGCGRSASCDQIITLSNLAPTIDCSALPTTVTCATDVAPGVPTFETSCALTGALIVDAVVVVGIPNCSGTTYTYNHTVSDGCGRSASCDQVITLSNLAPTIDCSSLITTATCASEAIAGTPIYTTSCALSGILVDPVLVISGPAGCNGTTYTYTHTVIDGCGREESCDQVIALNISGPTIDCSSLITTVNCVDEIVPGTPAISVACGLTTSLSVVGPTILGAEACDLSQYTYTHTVTDGCGQFASCDQTVTIADSPPVCKTKNITVFLNDIGEASITPESVDDGSSDLCGSVFLSVSRDAFSCSDLGVDNTVLLFVEDVCGNTSSCEAIVQVNDNVLPECPVQEEIIMQLGPGECSIPVSFALLVGADNCGVPVSSILPGQIASGSEFLIGSTQINYLVEDSSGNEATCALNITVNEFTESGLTCIGKLNISLGAECNTTLTPDLFLSGEIGCPDNCELTLFDHYDNQISNTVDGNDLGNTYIYKVCCGDNCCWGEVLIESKLAPVLDCSIPVDTISCIELASFSGPSLTGSGIIDMITGSGSSGCYAAEIDINILNEKVVKVDDCEGDIIKKVIRQYQAVDLTGNKSNICTQELYVTKLETDSIKFPVNSNLQLQCNSDFLVIDTSMVLGLDIVPYYCPPMTGSGIPITGSGTRAETIGDRFPVPLYPLPESVCNIVVDYEDEVIVDLPCKKQVLRTWNIRQWHCSEEYNETSIQLVTLVDTQAPVLVCPTDTIQVSTSGNDCSARVLLPEIGAVDSCQLEVAHIDMSYPGGFIENQNGGEVTGIPVGLHAVTYTAYDACNNSSNCNVYVNVVDERPPVIICERHTVVSIPTTGEAHVPADRFDDGSYDDCGQVILKVRRMDLSCQKTESDSTSIEFGDYAVFCCADAGSTHMVILRAYEHTGTASDTIGRYNECMVEVTVADKNPPSLVAPPDVTVSCDFIFDGSELGVFGKIADSESGRAPIVLFADSVNIAGSGYDGLSVGACNVPVVESVNMGDVNSCGIGKIVRTFTATSNGVTVTDEQMITVVSPVAFDSTRIEWPRDTVLYNTCNVASLDPDALLRGNDRPRITDGVCELLGISISDEQLFQPVIGQDACFKMFRTWSVIDWCDTDANGYPARWDSIQTLGVENNLAPVIRCASTPEVYNSFDANCNPVMVNLVARADDECTPGDQLRWTWSIDLGNDGVIDTTGVGNEVSASYIPGLHQIVWYAEDLCGNVSLPCTQNFEITNEKAAPAICLDHVVTDLVLMDTDWDGAVDIEMVEVWVSDVVKEDVHPCGHALSYSFDQSGVQDNIVYGCAEKGINEVTVWVTNLVNGAQSFCKTEIEVQDNNNIDLCGGVIHNPTSDSDVSGLIMTESGSQVAKVEVQILGSEIPNAQTDASGMYAFEYMAEGGNYTVVPNKDLEDINGVSTLDLVLIQKHILGLELLDSPYKMIAADINKSNTISATDIVQLRKLILGEIDEYSNNTSWRFVDEEHQFVDAMNPWSSVIPEDYEIIGLSSDMEVDFIGVKVGDVSGNAKGDALVRAEVRTNKDALTFVGRVVKEGQDQVVAFSSTEFTDVSGYQMTMEYDASQYELLRIEGVALNLSNDQIGMRYSERGMATMSWHSEKAVSVDGEETLFKAYFRPKSAEVKPLEVMSSSKVTREEAYIGSEVTDRVEIEMVGEEYRARMVINQNEPNPWRESTIISFQLPERGQVQFRLYDNTGKLIRSMKDNYGVGVNEIMIGRDLISTAGIYLYEVQYKNQIEHKRMIVLD